MVSRVAFLCNKKNGNITNIEDELAMVTFTNDAADNMKTRLKQMFINYYILTGNECYLKYIEGVDRANISTIHKFALYLLRGASFYTGLGTNFRITSDEYNSLGKYQILSTIKSRSSMNKTCSKCDSFKLYQRSGRIRDSFQAAYGKSICL